MKKFLLVFLCVVALLCVTPVVAFAEGETATESEIPAAESVTETEVVEAEKPLTEVITEWIQAHVTDLGVIGTLCMTIFYEVRKHKSLNGSIGTLNNNAIAVAENSAATINQALAGVKDMANIVNSYKDEIATLLGEIRKSAEEKQSLETTLNHVEAFLKTAKLATLELSNEVAELLVLANIPNSKKEELYARHTKAIEELKAAEEVMSNDGNETN